MVKNNKIVNSFQSFIHPGCNIPPFITSLTGINDEHVRDAPFFEDIVSEILEANKIKKVLAYSDEKKNGILQKQI